MKRIALFLLAMLLLTLPAMAETVDALPVPEDCTVKEDFLAPNSISYLDFGDEHGDYFRGWVGEKTAMFIEDTPEGRVFVGYVRQEDGWLRTTSTPLPEGTYVQHMITKENTFGFSFPHPEGLTNQDGTLLYIHNWFTLDPDGVWRFRGAQADIYDVPYLFTEDALLVNLFGYAYGACNFDRDVRTLDWDEVPLSWQEALQCISPDMGVIGINALPLYADAACTEQLAEYRLGTPVTVLSREGNMAQVRIADSAVTGWLAEESLLLGEKQLVVWQSAGIGGTFTVMASYQAPRVKTSPGSQMHLYDAPDGNVVYVLESTELCQLMSDLGNGWYHVCVDAYVSDILLEEEMFCSFYVRAGEDISIMEMSGLPNTQQHTDENGPN